MSHKVSCVFYVVLAIACYAATGYGEQPISFRVVGWNMQSDFTTNQQESDPQRLKAQMAAKQGVHIWGLCEVLDEDSLDLFEEGAEDGENTDFVAVMGTTGNRDRMAILYDTARFEQIGSMIELTHIQISSGLRAPLAVRLRGRSTGLEFLFMVNHLARGNAESRREQCKLLNDWARGQQLPVIIVGDYNLDFDIDDGDLGVPHRDAGFDKLTLDGIFQWVRPERMVKSQSANQFNSILDFVFVANAPFNWTGTSQILDQDGDQPALEVDFDDDEDTSDHRPVDATFTMAGPVVASTPIVPRAAAARTGRPVNNAGRPTVPAAQPRAPAQPRTSTPPSSAPPRGSREELLRRLEALETEIREIRRSLNSPPDNR